jgi:hypothetical protein
MRKHRLSHAVKHTTSACFMTQPGLAVPVRHYNIQCVHVSWYYKAHVSLGCRWKRRPGCACQTLQHTMRACFVTQPGAPCPWVADEGEAAWLCLSDTTTYSYNACMFRDTARRTVFLGCGWKRRPGCACQTEQHTMRSCFVILQGARVLGLPMKETTWLCLSDGTTYNACMFSDTARRTVSLGCRWKRRPGRPVARLASLQFPTTAVWV